MLLMCYLASAVVFYYLVARSARPMEEPALNVVAQPAVGETIELFPDAADRAASRAA
jgi:hypothetical protein